MLRAVAPRSDGRLFVIIWFRSSGVSVTATQGQNILFGLLPEGVIALNVDEVFVDQKVMMVYEIDKSKTIHVQTPVAHAAGSRNHAFGLSPVMMDTMTRSVRSRPPTRFQNASPAGMSNRLDSRSTA